MMELREMKISFVSEMFLFQENHKINVNLVFVKLYVLLGLIKLE
jgi:hypothetical protein